MACKEVDRVHECRMRLEAKFVRVGQREPFDLSIKPTLMTVSKEDI
jgi:hypothetical protein